MFLHEMIKGVDPSHVVFEGESRVTYGELAEALRRYRNCLYETGWPFILPTGRSLCMCIWQW